MPIHVGPHGLTRGRLTAAALAVCLALCPGELRADTPLPVLGGPGGGAFDARCPARQVLWGVELRAADDVDAIRPVCAAAVQVNQVTGDTALEIWHGGEGGTARRLTCPLARPAVLGLYVSWEGVKTVIVNNVHLFCGLVTDQAQTLETTPSAVFDGPSMKDTGVFGSLSFSNLIGDMQRCSPGQVAVGLHGRSGVWLDAVGLICDASPVSPATVHSIGRVPTNGKPGPQHSVCQEAALARSKGWTVAAAALDQKCLDSFKHN